MDEQKIEQKIIAGIEHAKKAGVNLFIQGLIHNYSIEKKTLERIIYLPFPGDPVLTGKRIFAEEEAVRLVQPDVILLEGYAPDEIYECSSCTDKFAKEISEEILEKTYFETPNLCEIISEVVSAGIKVKGCDLSQEERKQSKQRNGYNNFKGKNLDKLLRDILKIRIAKKKVAPVIKEVIEQHLQKECPYPDLYNSNELYHTCVRLEELTNIYSSMLPCPQITVFRETVLNKAKESLKKHLGERDLRVFRIVFEELRGGKTVLLKIGNVHLDDDYASLPYFLSQQKIPYYHFYNYREHTPEEIELSKNFVCTA